jgi:hypothetical protein
MLSKKPKNMKHYSSIFRRPMDEDESLHSVNRSTSWYYASDHVLVNRARTAAGLPPLGRFSKLDQLARDHADRMSRKEALFHSCQTIEELGARLDSGFVGEIVQSEKTIGDIHTKMMTCCWQRQHILSKTFTHLGTGTAKGSDGMLYMVLLFRAEKATEAYDDCILGDDAGQCRQA